MAAFFGDTGVSAGEVLKHLYTIGMVKNTMRKRVLGRVDSKAISPVIATVILVAITIVVALAFAFWASGLVASFQATERLEVRVLHVGPTNVTIQIRNVGSNDVVITDITTLQQGTPVSDLITASFSLTPGETTRISSAHGANPGTTFQVVVVTSSGNAYYATGTVP
jgi:flagellin-like protein